MRQVPKWLSTTASFVLVLSILALIMIKPVRPEPVEEVIQEEVVTSALSFTTPITIGDVPVNVALAITEEEHAQGLSDTAPLTMDQGMLFVFDSPQVASFWMNDMNYALDIIWIDSAQTVVDISPNLDPATYPESFSPKSPVLYALEVPAGFSMTNDITVGDMLVIQ